MAEKKTSKAKKVVDKVVDAVKELGEQPMQEQALMSGKVPQAEPENETPAQARQREKDQGISLGQIDGINVESRNEQIIVTFPSRKEINYLFTENAIGMKFRDHGYSAADDSNKLFEKEKLQVRTLAFNSADLNPETLPKLGKVIDQARAVNNEYLTERNEAMAYFKSVAGNDQIAVMGNKFTAVANEQGGKDFKPGWINADVVKIGKHLIAAVEGSNNGVMYARLIKTSDLHLQPQDYADKQSAVRGYFQIKHGNLKTIEVDGKPQEIIVGVKKYMAWDADFKVSKINDYAPKQTQTRNQGQSMAM